MRILVLHAWLKGNLGDVLQLSVLLSSLRELRPRVLDLAGFPPQPPPETGEVLARADRYIPDPFPWYWGMAPSWAGKAAFAPWWRNRRRSLFTSYDAIVCAPGPYLADYDLRATSALADIATATELGRPVVLASHSIGPLHADSIAVVARATARVARELATYRYLCERGMSAIRSADLAFLYPYGEVERPARERRPYRLAFLRSNNLDVNALRLVDGALYEGERLIAASGAAPLILASSDRRRDERFLARAARRLDLPLHLCRSVPELVALIAGATEVISDRYHPAICAASLGKPACVIPNREPHKMEGLTDLLSGAPVAELQDLARAGLRAVHDALRTHV